MIPGLDQNALLSNPILSTLPMHVFLHDFEAERVYGSQTRTVAGDTQVLRVLFQSETSSINKLRDAGELMEAMRGILEGYRRLYEVATTLHRDICPENLMFYKEAGNIFGVLMKFDSDTPHPAVQQGPGKGPFMSRDLLVADTGRAIHHFYRHDLESLMYVIAFLACQIHGSSMERWKSLDMTDLLLQKIHVLNEGFPPLKDNFKAFTKALRALQYMFVDAFTTRVRHLDADDNTSYDFETLGGAITFDKFLAHLGKFEKKEEEEFV